jgi:pSer/pThr/pTyr-binding forkhead associated (FHA) protein
LGATIASQDRAVFFWFSRKGTSLADQFQNRYSPEQLLPWLRFDPAGQFDSVGHAKEVAMSSATIILAIQGGMLDGKELVFKRRSLCIVGRSRDCDLKIPTSPFFFSVSRHHCLFDVDPPSVHVRDLGSLNGTFVNGVRIGEPAHERSGASPGQDAEPTGVPLKDGDKVSVGSLVISIKIPAPLKVADHDRLDHDPLEEKTVPGPAAKANTSPDKHETNASARPSAAPIPVAS